MLSSEVKADLLVLFHKNPTLMDTVDGVARRIGRKANSIEADVKDLVDLGLFRMKRIGKSEAILFDRKRDREVQEAVANYLKSLKTVGGV